MSEKDKDFVLNICRKKLSQLVSDILEDLQENHHILSSEDREIINGVDILVEKLLINTCEKYKHYVTDDNCGKPEHRYCLYCSESTPNEEPS